MSISGGPVTSQELPGCPPGARGVAAVRLLEAARCPPALASPSPARPPVSRPGLLVTLPGPAPSGRGGGPSLPGPVLPLLHLPGPPVSFLQQPPYLQLTPPVTPCPTLFSLAPVLSEAPLSCAQLFSRLTPWNLRSCPVSTQLVTTLRLRAAPGGPRQEGSCPGHWPQPHALGMGLQSGSSPGILPSPHPETPQAPRLQVP